VKAALLAIAVAACTSTPLTPCQVETHAFCDANLACDGLQAANAKCLSSADGACAAQASLELTDEAAEMCADAWDSLSCVAVYGSDGSVTGHSLDWTPTAIGCLEQAWKCGAEGGTSTECAQ
jgi:hypothetical protein